MENRLIDGTLALRLVGDSIPLEPLGELSDAVDEVRGTAHGDVRVVGSWEHPAFDGTLTAALPQVRLTSTGVMLRDVASTLRFSGDTMHVDTLVAHSGGSLRVTGDILLASLTEPQLQLAFDMHDARVLDDETGELFADGSVKVDGALDTLTVNGKVAITRGVVYIPEPAQYDVISTADPAIFAVTDSTTAQALGVAPPSAMLRNLQMQVAVEVQRGTFARSPDANVEVYGTLDVRKARGVEDYSISGALYTDQGTYSFLGKRFDVARGAVRFLGTEELNPVLQIVASYEIAQAGRSPLDIRVLIGGTLEKPTRFAGKRCATADVAVRPDLLPRLRQVVVVAARVAGNGTGRRGRGGSSLAGNVAALASRQLAAIGLGALLDEVRGELAGRDRRRRPQHHPGADPRRREAGRLPNGSQRNRDRDREVRRPADVRDRPRAPDADRSRCRDRAAPHRSRAATDLAGDAAPPNPSLAELGARTAHPAGNRRPAHLDHRLVAACGAS